METKRFALFLRQLAESLREDLHARAAHAAGTLDAYAQELDPIVAAPEVEAPELTKADEESAAASTKHAPRHPDHGHARR